MRLGWGWWLCLVVPLLLLEQGLERVLAAQLVQLGQLLLEAVWRFRSPVLDLGLAELV
ncbi:hypothetical protein AB0M57_03225 [Streptomyces sp. NPDC051597]|uniref:hypothetical protein n=1 Tax=Streptomyces sp. NPDC051597 TaxID=3155049 RepID=UPI00342AB891